MLTGRRNLCIGLAAIRLKQATNSPTKAPPMKKPPSEHCWLTDLDLAYFRTLIDLPPICIYELARRFAEEVCNDGEGGIVWAPW